MTSFTLDTNCLIDIDDDRPAAPFVRRLLTAAETGQADVAMVASSASERQPGGGTLETIRDFEQRMVDLGFGHLRLLQPIARWGMAFYGHGIMPSEAQMERELAVFRALFPDMNPSWPEYAAEKGVDVEGDSRASRIWKNAMCDVQAFWTHDWNGRDVFVTSDANFVGRLVGQPSFSAVRISTPEIAAAVLNERLDH